MVDCVHTLLRTHIIQSFPCSIIVVSFSIDVSFNTHLYRRFERYVNVMHFETIATYAVFTTFFWKITCKLWNELWGVFVKFDIFKRAQVIYAWLVQSGIHVDQNELSKNWVYWIWFSVSMIRWFMSNKQNKVWCTSKCNIHIKWRDSYRFLHEF